MYDHVPAGLPATHEGCGVKSLHVVLLHDMMLTAESQAKVTGRYAS